MIGTRAIQAGFLLLLLVAWWAATANGLVPALFLPAPGAVVQAFLTTVQGGDFARDLLTTLLSILVAYAIAIVAGFAVGIALGRTRVPRLVIEPLLAGAFAVPLIILYPLVLFLLGIGPASKIAFAALYGFFPVALNTISGFAQVERRYVQHAVSLGATPWRMFRHVLLPAAFPQILAGLRVSFVITAASVVAGEMIASLSGLGHRITFYAETLEPASMFAQITLVIALTVGVNAALGALERK